MCDPASMRDLANDFREFKEDSIIMMSAMSGIIFALSIILIIKIACDCRASKTANQNIELRPKSENFSNRISLRKFSEAFKFRPTELSRNSLNSEFSVTNENSKSVEQNVYDNIRANDNFYDHPKTIQTQISKDDDDVYEAVDEFQKNPNEMNQTIYQSDDTVISASDPENIYDVLDVKVEIYDEIDAEDLKNYIASRIYDEFPQRDLEDPNKKIAFDRKSFLKSAAHENYENKADTNLSNSIPKLPPKTKKIEMTTNVNQFFENSKSKTNVIKSNSDNSKFCTNQSPTTSKFTVGQPFIEREDEDVIYMSLNEIRERGYVKKNKEAIDETFNKIMENQKTQNVKFVKK